MGDAALDEEFSREPVEFLRQVQRAFATDRFGTSAVNENSFVLVPDDKEEDSEL